jgi:transcription antitermination factor NusG
MITTYCGPVKDYEVADMESVQGKLLSEIKTSKFVRGDKVILKSGPLKGYDARVSSVSGVVIKVKVIATILGFTGHEVSCAEDQLERKAELQNTVVQNINKTTGV